MKLLTESAYVVEPFGRDCYGNITGYRVVRRGWHHTGNPRRSDGMSWEVEQFQQFPGDIYKEGSFAAAKRQAEELAAKLNREAPQLVTAR